MSIARTAKAPITDERSLVDWLAKAKIGERATYFYGNLSKERLVNRSIETLAEKVSLLHKAGRVLMFLHRQGRGTFNSDPIEYIVERRAQG